MKFTFNQIYSNEANGKLQRIVVLGDAHDSPKLDKIRFELFGKYVTDAQPDQFVVIGDFINFDSLCGHTPNFTAKGREKKTFNDDLASAREALHVLMSNIKVRVPLVFCEGNHEYRARRFADNNPELGDLLINQIRALFLNFKWVEYGAYHFVDQVGFTHIPFNGAGKPFSGVNSSATIALNATHDIVHGHTHKPQRVVRAKTGSKKSVVIVDAGCSLPYGYVEPYAMHSMNGWEWGITEVVICNGSIVGYKFISLPELYAMYA